MGNNSNRDDRQALSRGFQTFAASGIRTIARGPNSNVPLAVPAFRLGSTVYLVLGDAFFTGQSSSGVAMSNAIGFQGMSLSQIQDALLIHEYLHKTGVVGPDSNGQNICSAQWQNGYRLNGCLGGCARCVL